MCVVGVLFLFDLILYVPSTIFQLNKDGSSWVEPVLSYDKCVLLKDHKAVTPVRLETAVVGVIVCNEHWEGGIQIELTCNSKLFSL